MSREPEEGFLSRWSRRKLEPEDEPRPAPVEEAAEAEPALSEETEAETLARLQLPDPDTLGAGDDFAPFMQAAVPEYLRKRALRRLWRSNPTLAVLDGLNDYDDDFTGGFVPPGTLKTAYEVGKGIVSRTAEALDPVEPDDAIPDASADGETNEPDQIDQELADRPAPPGVEMAQAPETEREQDLADEPAPRPARRRMAFRTPGGG